MVDKIIKLFFDRKDKKVFTYKRRTDDKNNLKKEFKPILKLATEMDFINHENRCRKILMGDIV